jgi:hypothetical protein
MRSFGGQLGIWGESSKKKRCLKSSQRSDEILNGKCETDSEHRGGDRMANQEFGVRRNFECLERFWEQHRGRTMRRLGDSKN